MHLTPLLLTNCLQKDLQENRLPQESGNPNRQYYDMCDDVQSNTALFLKLVYQIPIHQAAVSYTHLDVYKRQAKMHPLKSLTHFPYIKNKNFLLISV